MADKQKELKIGDVISFGFRKFKVVPKKTDDSVGCTKVCDLLNICLDISNERRKELIGSCFSHSRRDNKDVVFVEIDD